MQPPGSGGEDSLAASQVVGAGFAVPVDEGLIALQGLDPRPGVLARHAGRQPTARLACARMRVPVLLQDAPAAEELDAFLAALGSGFLLSLTDLVAQELGVLDMAQALEPGRAAKVQVDYIGQVIVFGVEESDRLGWPSIHNE
jgi:hypothetical protein